MASYPLALRKDGDLPPGAYYQYNKSVALPENWALAVDPGHQSWAPIYQSLVSTQTTSGVFSARRSYLAQSSIGSRIFADWNAYDQYEAAVPLENAADCLDKVGKKLYGDDHLAYGFRAPSLVRFVNSEKAYLSPTNGGARMYVNMEDHVSYNTGRPNVEFLKTLEAFRDECGARFHWGKAGWPYLFPCFDGFKHYGEDWCKFGCAVQELDPEGKFSGISNVWHFEATLKGSGESANSSFASCCSASGFNQDKCQCAQRPASTC
eukprot:jgi/Botrbrau1/1535/Bobra.0107s0023.1